MRTWDPWHNLWMYIPAILKCWPFKVGVTQNGTKLAILTRAMFATITLEFLLNLLFHPRLNPTFCMCAWFHLPIFTTKRKHQFIKLFSNTKFSKLTQKGQFIWKMLYFLPSGEKVQHLSYQCQRNSSHRQEKSTLTQLIEGTKWDKSRAESTTSSLSACIFTIGKKCSGKGTCTFSFGKIPSSIVWEMVGMRIFSFLTIDVIWGVGVKDIPSPTCAITFKQFGAGSWPKLWLASFVR